MRLRPLLLALALATTLPMTSQATPADLATAAQPGTLLSIAASAEASRAPDIATLSTGVVTQSLEANTAMRNLSLIHI